MFVYIAQLNCADYLECLEYGGIRQFHVASPWLHGSDRLSEQRCHDARRFNGKGRYVEFPVIRLRTIELCISMAQLTHHAFGR